MKVSENGKPYQRAQPIKSLRTRISNMVQFLISEVKNYEKKFNEGDDCIEYW